MNRLFTTFARTLVVGALVSACRSGDAPTSPLTVTTAAATLSAKAPDAKDLCKAGGFANYTRPDRSTFKNQGDCVSFAAQGGTLVPVSVLPVITSFTFDGTRDACATGGGNHPLFTATFTGGTAMISAANDESVAVTSGVQLAFGTITGQTFTLTVTNSSGSTTRSLTPFPDMGNLATGCPPSGDDMPPS